MAFQIEKLGDLNIRKSTSVRIISSFRDRIFDTIHNYLEDGTTWIDGGSYVNVKVYRKKNANGKFKYGFKRHWYGEKGDDFGREKTPLEYDDVQFFKFYGDLMYIVKVGGMQQLIDYVGRKETKQYDGVENVKLRRHVGVLRVKKGNKKGIVIGNKGTTTELDDDDGRGKLVFEPIFRKKEETEWKELIEPKYDDIEVVELLELSPEGMVFKVREGDKIGIVNDKGEEIIKPKYDDIEIAKFKNKKISFIVREGDKKGIVNDKGEEVVKPRYDDIINLISEYDDFPLDFGNVNVLMIKLGEKYGLMSADDGSVIIKPEFVAFKIYDDSEGYKIIFKKQNGEKVVYNKNGVRNYKISVSDGLDSLGYFTTKWKK